MRCNALPLLFVLPFIPGLVASADHGPTRTKHSARGVTTILPYNVANPGATPLFVQPPAPSLLPVNSVVQFIHATSAPPTSVLGNAAVALVNTVATGNSANLLSIVKNLVPSLTCSLFGGCTVSSANAASTIAAIIGPNCIDSTMNDTVINSLLSYGGAGTVVYICQNAVVPLQNEIQYTASFQGITTKPNDAGAPLLSSARGTLRVMGQNLATAVLANCPGCSYLSLTSVNIDGNRPNLGYLSTGNALIEMGGTNNNGHVVNGISSFEPRTWTALHLAEGDKLSCTNSTVTNNQIGPSGHAPTANQRLARKSAAAAGVTYPAGQWADGISLACKASTVTGNTVTDATDGGIVIFGAPGSKITGNTIISNTRQLLGGINAVDWAPNGGIYTGTVVSGNAITASGAMIKIGIAIGYMSWTSPNDTSKFTNGGTFSGNTFTTSGSGYFGFGITADGANTPSITGNVVSLASFGGSLGSGCINNYLPTFQPFVKNPYTTKGIVAQSSFTNAVFSYAICSNPGPLTSTGTSVAGN